MNKNEDLNMELLNVITTLSHEFGAQQFVKAGGGNSSVKTKETLWIKPSGVSLANIKINDFVKVDRNALQQLHNMTPPQNPTLREQEVTKLLKASVIEGSGRPSVETPLHDAFDQSFVVHTHPPIINGLLCSNQSKGYSNKLFPNALWMPYTDPGFTLSSKTREQMEDWKKAHGAHPSILFIQNHGVFVAANTADDVRSIYKHIFTTLRAVYNEAGIMINDTECQTTQMDAKLCGLGNVLKKHEFGIAIPRPAHIAAAPITPDHVVYLKAFPLISNSTEIKIDDINRYEQKFGYSPKVIITPAHLIAVGESEVNAKMILDIALDAAEVTRYAQAFGGICELNEESWQFIEHWEAENYRRKQI